MTTGCQINFKQNTLGIYYAGQTVYGTVELTFAKPKMIQGVCISFDGFAYTNWSEQKSYRDHKGETQWRTVRYGGRETYMNSKTYLKKADQGSSFEMVAGTHLFDFVCVLPTHLPSSFEENTLGIYYAGQTVYGTVELNFAKPKMIQGVYISFDGFAYTSWTERKSYRSGGKTKWRSVRYRGRETYMNSRTYLKRADQGGSIEMAAGSHLFDFVCVLPTQLPSSYEGYYGHVRYSIKITLERSWKFNRKFKRRFTVLKHLDLNYLPHLQTPIKFDLHKEFTWSMFVKGPIKFTVGIPMGGFVPGQLLPVSIIVDNPSKVDVTEINIKLKQKVMYYSEYPSRHSRREKKQIAGKRLTESNKCVPKKTNRQFEESIIIPAVPPTCTDLCKIIVTTYSLLVEFDFSGMHSAKTVKFPITIGTVPMLTPQVISSMVAIEPAEARPTAPEQPGPGWDVKAPSAPSYSEIDASFLLSYDDIVSGHPELASIAPPSYAECVYGGIEMADGGNDDEADDKGAEETGRYVPLYPVYRFNPTAPPGYSE